MQEIIKFSGKLRDNGIPASIRSTEIACKALPLINSNHGDLREALACIYLKDQRQRDKFDEIYDQIFEEKEDTPVNTVEENKYNFKTKYKLKLTIDSASENNTGSLAYLTRTNNMFDYMRNHVDDSTLNNVKLEYIENTLGGSSDKPFKDDSGLLKSNLQTLNSLQPELIDLCQSLGRKIATKRVKRYKRSKKQIPDIRRTIHKNMKHGGTLLELVQCKPKIKKQNHYFLNDVSVSCDWISLWFFSMVYAAQNSFSRLRAFEFTDKTAEITSALQELDLVSAFLKVIEIRRDNGMVQGKSNMYTAFNDFLKQANINSKSYVLILSDCRDWAGPLRDGNPLSADYVGEMVKKAKRVLILNPEPEIKWNAADSRVSSYEDMGADVFEVGDLQQLADLIIEI